MATTPVVLVVEDNPKSRKTRSELLRSYDFVVFDAADEEDAIRQLHSVPSLDLVVTDINLDPKSSVNKAGLSLARSIRAEHASIPIIGYSAFFEDRDLTPAERTLFSDYIGKGKSRVSDLDRRVEQWHTLALEHRKARLEAAAAELDRLRVKYDSPNPDFATLLLLRPDREDSPSLEELSVEEILSQLGYQLHIIEPGTSRPALNTSEAKVISPLIVWVKPEDNIIVAEVYGYPLLYAFGDTESEALTQLLLLMDGFHKELVVDKPTPESLSSAMQRLADFLKYVFG